MEEPKFALPGAEHDVRLSPGRHDSPRDGACVIELASLLAGEEFSDRPRCVCPVIGAFLRAWNDRAAYADRQRLRPYAQRVIGSRAPAVVTRQRRDICLEWAGARLDGRLRRTASLLAMRARVAVFVGIPEALRLDDGAPEYAARLLIGRRDLAGAFMLLDAMLAIGHAAGDGGSVLESAGETEPIATNGNGHAPAANGNGRVPSGANGNGASANGNGNGHVEPAGNGNGGGAQAAGGGGAAGAAGAAAGT